MRRGRDTETLSLHLERLTQTGGEYLNGDENHLVDVVARGWLKALRKRNGKLVEGAAGLIQEGKTITIPKLLAILRNYPKLEKSKKQEIVQLITDLREVIKTFPKPEETKKAS